MDELNLYDDLDEFQEQQDKKSKELLGVEEKYKRGLKTIENLEIENKTLIKKIQRIELSFQSLLDTARAELKRKDKEIDRLRKEKDDICFRRRTPHQRNNETETETAQFTEKSTQQQQFVKNPFRSDTAPETVTVVSTTALTEKDHGNLKEPSDKTLRSEDFQKRFIEPYKRNRSRDDDRKDHSKKPKCNNIDEKYQKSNESHKIEIKNDRDARNKDRLIEAERGQNELSGRRNLNRNRLIRDRSPNRKNHDTKYLKAFDSTEHNIDRFDRARSRDGICRISDRSRESKKSSKSAESPDRISNRLERGRSRVRELSDHHHKGWTKHKSRDRKNNDKNTNMFSKSPERNIHKQSKDRDHHNRPHHNDYFNKKPEKSRSSLDQDLGLKDVTKLKEIAQINECHIDEKEISKQLHENNAVNLTKILETKEVNDNNDKSNDKLSEEAFEVIGDNDKESVYEFELANSSKQDVLEVTKPKLFAAHKDGFTDKSAKLTSRCSGTMDSFSAKDRIDLTNVYELEDAKLLKCKVKEDGFKAQMSGKQNSNASEKLSTPRKIALFDSLFGLSPSSISSSPSATTSCSSSKSLLTNIMGILASKTNIKDAVTTTPSPEDNTNHNSCIQTPLKNEDNTNDANEFDKCFTKNVEIAKNEINIISSIDMTDEHDNTDVNDIEFVQIPGLDFQTMEKTKNISLNDKLDCNEKLLANEFEEDISKKKILPQSVDSNILTTAVVEKQLNHNDYILIPGLDLLSIAKEKCSMSSETINANLEGIETKNSTAIQILETDIDKDIASTSPSVKESNDLETFSKPSTKLEADKDKSTRTNTTNKVHISSESARINFDIVADNNGESITGLKLNLLPTQEILKVSDNEKVLQTMENSKKILTETKEQTLESLRPVESDINNVYTCQISIAGETSKVNQNNVAPKSIQIDETVSQTINEAANKNIEDLKVSKTESVSTKRFESHTTEKIRDEISETVPNKTNNTANNTDLQVPLPDSISSQNLEDLRESHTTEKSVDEFTENTANNSALRKLEAHQVSVPELTIQDQNIESHTIEKTADEISSTIKTTNKNIENLQNTNTKLTEVRNQNLESQITEKTVRKLPVNENFLDAENKVDKYTRDVKKIVEKILESHGDDNQNKIISENHSFDISKENNTENKNIITITSSTTKDDTFIRNINKPKEKIHESHEEETTTAKEINVLFENHSTDVLEENQIANKDKISINVESENPVHIIPGLDLISTFEQEVVEHHDKSSENDSSKEVALVTENVVIISKYLKTNAPNAESHLDKSKINIISDLDSLTKFESKKTDEIDKMDEIPATCSKITENSSNTISSKRKKEFINHTTEVAMTISDVLENQNKRQVKNSIKDSLDSSALVLTNTQETTKDIESEATNVETHTTDAISKIVTNSKKIINNETENQKDLVQIASIAKLDLTPIKIPTTTDTKIEEEEHEKKHTLGEIKAKDSNSSDYVSAYNLKDTDSTDEINILVKHDLATTKDIPSVKIDDVSPVNSKNIIDFISTQTATNDIEHAESIVKIHKTDSSFVAAVAGNESPKQTNNFDKEGRSKTKDLESLNQSSNFEFKKPVEYLKKMFEHSNQSSNIESKKRADHVRHDFVLIHDLEAAPSLDLLKVNENHQQIVEIHSKCEIPDKTLSNEKLSAEQGYLNETDIDEGIFITNNESEAKFVHPKDVPPLDLKTIPMEEETKDNENENNLELHSLNETNDGISKSDIVELMSAKLEHSKGEVAPPLDLKTIPVLEETRDNENEHILEQHLLNETNDIISKSDNVELLSGKSSQYIQILDKTVLEIPNDFIPCLGLTHDFPKVSNNNELEKSLLEYVKFNKKSEKNTPNPEINKQTSHMDQEEVFVISNDHVISSKSDNNDLEINKDSDNTTKASENIPSPDGTEKRARTASCTEEEETLIISNDHRNSKTSSKIECKKDQSEIVSTHLNLDLVSVLSQNTDKEIHDSDEVEDIFDDNSLTVLPTATNNVIKSGSKGNSNFALERLNSSKEFLDLDLALVMKNTATERKTIKPVPNEDSAQLEVSTTIIDNILLPEETLNVESEIIVLPNDNRPSIDSILTSKINDHPYREPQSRRHTNESSRGNKISNEDLTTNIAPYQASKEASSKLSNIQSSKQKTEDVVHALDSANNENDNHLSSSKTINRDKIYRDEDDKQTEKSILNPADVEHHKSGLKKQCLKNIPILIGVENRNSDLNAQMKSIQLKSDTVALKCSDVTVAETNSKLNDDLNINANKEAETESDSKHDSNNKYILKANKSLETNDLSPNLSLLICVNELNENRTSLDELTNKSEDSFNIPSSKESERIIKSVISDKESNISKIDAITKVTGLDKSDEIKSTNALLSLKVSMNCDRQENLQIVDENTPVNATPNQEQLSTSSKSNKVFPKEIQIKELDEALLSSNEEHKIDTDIETNKVFNEIENKSSKIAIPQIKGITKIQSHIKSPTAMQDSYNITTMLPSISTNSPTPPNFSGIFSKKCLQHAEEDDFVNHKHKRRLPHLSTTKPREYVLLAASVLCNADNLENANKKLHWELLENKNELTEIEDDTDVDNTDEERYKTKEEPEPPPRLTPYKCMESLTSDSETQSEDESRYKSLNFFNSGTNKQKPLDQRRKTIDTVPITHAVSYYKHLEELERNKKCQNMLNNNEPKKQLKFLTNKAKQNKYSGQMISKNVKVKLKSAGDIRVRNVESLMVDHLVEETVVTGLKSHTKDTPSPSPSVREFKKRGRPKKKCDNDKNSETNTNPGIQKSDHQKTNEIENVINDWEEKRKEKGDQMLINNCQKTSQQKNYDTNIEINSKNVLHFESNKQSKTNEKNQQDNEENLSDQQTNSKEQHQEDTANKTYWMSNVNKSLDEHRIYQEFLSSCSKNVKESTNTIIADHEETSSDNSEIAFSQENVIRNKSNFKNRCSTSKLENEADNCLQLLKTNKNAPKCNKESQVNIRKHLSGQSENKKQCPRDKIVEHVVKGAIMMNDNLSCNADKKPKEKVFDEINKSGFDVVARDVTAPETSKIENVQNNKCSTIQLETINSEQPVQNVATKDSLKQIKTSITLIDGDRDVEKIQHTSIIYDKEDSTDDHNTLVAESSEPECNKYLQEDELPSSSKETKSTNKSNLQGEVPNERDQKFSVLENDKTIKQLKVRRDSVKEPIEFEKDVQHPNEEKSKETQTDTPTNKCIILMKSNSEVTKTNAKNVNATAVVANNKKKIISLEEIGIKVRPFKGHLSSFRIPKVNKELEGTKDESWKLETYSEVFNETQHRNKINKIDKHCDKEKYVSLKEKEDTSLQQYKEKNPESKNDKGQALKPKKRESKFRDHIKFNKREENKEGEILHHHKDITAKSSKENTKNCGSKIKETNQHVRYIEDSYQNSQNKTQQTISFQNNKDGTSCSKDFNQGNISKNSHFIKESSKLCKSSKNISAISKDTNLYKLNETKDLKTSSNEVEKQKIKEEAAAIIKDQRNSLAHKRKLFSSEMYNFEDNNNENEIVQVSSNKNSDSCSSSNDNHPKSDSEDNILPVSQKSSSLKSRQKPINLQRRILDSSSDEESKKIRLKTSQYSQVINPDGKTSTLCTLKSLKARRNSVNLHRRVLDSSCDEDTEGNSLEKNLSNKKEKDNTAELQTACSTNMNQIHKAGNKKKDSEELNQSAISIKSLRIVNNSKKNEFNQIKHLESQHIVDQIEVVNCNTDSVCTNRAAVKALRRKSMNQEKVCLNIQRKEKEIETQCSADKNQDNVINCDDETDNTKQLKKPFKIRRKSMYQESHTSIVQLSESKIDNKHSQNNLDKIQLDIINLNKERKYRNPTPPKSITSLKMRRKSIYHDRVSSNIKHELSEIDDSQHLAPHSSLDKNQLDVINSNNEKKCTTLPPKNKLSLNRRTSMYQDSVTVNIIEEEPKKYNQEPLLQCSLDKTHLELRNCNKDKDDTNEPSKKIRRKSFYHESGTFINHQEREKSNKEEHLESKSTFDKNPLAISNCNKEKKDTKTADLKMRRTSMYQDSKIQDDEKKNEEQNQNSLKYTHALSHDNHKTELEIEQDTHLLQLDLHTDTQHKPDTNFNTVPNHNKEENSDKSTVKMNINIDSSQPINQTQIVKQNKAATPLADTKSKSRKRRVVKVLSTSREEPPNYMKNLQIQQTTNQIPITPPLVSPTLSHPIFTTEVTQQQTDFVPILPPTPNKQYDEKFKEIDSKLHEIFQSPQYMSDYKTTTHLLDATNETGTPLTLNVSKPDITIEETIVCNPENVQSSMNSTNHNDSMNMNDTSAHNQSEIKHLLVGSSEYRFEKVSDNVVNLFISRKRKRKRTN